MTTKKSNGTKKKPRPKPDLTPEYIAEQRAIREKRKAEKRLASEAAGINLNENQDLLTNISVIKRPMLNVSQASGGISFTIMSYNVLAQSLMFRDLFPENGDARKWKVRSKMLSQEIQNYNPDIMCLQEVDRYLVETFWKELLEGLGLSFRFATIPNKSHGNIIAFRTDLFKLIDETFINYDQIEIPNVPSQIDTQNTGLILQLAFQNHPNGIFVGTTHLFWHPKGSYERTRQMYLFMNKALTMVDRKPDWKLFLTGDFNSECFDSPYSYATSLSWNDDTRRTAESSLSHNYGKSASWDISAIIHELEKLFKSQNRKLVSLYGSQYRKVHPSNVHPKSNGEPNFSNWAHSWRGLLDYIFVVDEQGPPIKVLDLLRMPEPEEMGPEPSGQPRVNQYPSDHLCLMARVNIS